MSLAYREGERKMKKLLTVLVAVFTVLAVTACNSQNGTKTLVVYTEAGFAPFEYESGNAICGVDVDIMNLVGEELGMNVQFENVAFDSIIDAVSAGKLTNVGAAGLSVTEERQQKVDFSTVYYQANLYVIYNVNNAPASKTMTDGNTGVYWSNLTTTKGIGIQDGTTADFFLSDEIAEGGSLEGVSKTSYDALSIAVMDITKGIDYVIIDELPAKTLVANNENLGCLPLYYEGAEGEEDVLAYDEYAICVTKGETEILAAINKVLAELLKEDENGVTGVQKLVNKHLGLTE